MNLVRVGEVLIALLLVTATAESDVLYNIQFSPRPEAAIQFNQYVNITFNYRTSHAGGVRIFARPMTGGVLSPNYAAHGSPIYPPGAGIGSGYFTITSGPITVDAVRFQVLDTSQTTLLLEFYVPVKYLFSEHAIFGVALTPQSPSSIQFNQYVSVLFSYRTTQAGGVRIFTRPMSGSTTTPGYAASPSPLYPTGSDTASGWFTITAGNAKVDGIRFQMYDAAQANLLLEFIAPVNYDYGAHSISNIQLNPASPQGLQLNSNVTISFDYRTSQPGGVLIFPRPFTAGALSPGYGASGSPTYPTGSGSGTGYFTFPVGEVTVDSVRLQMTSLDQSQTLLEYFVPVNFHYSAHKIADVGFSPSSPAYFTTNEPDTTLFSYTTSQSGGVLVFPRPFTAGALSPGYAASGSPTYPTGSGTGFGWFSITGGNVLVDQMRLTMSNTGQTQTLVEWLYPVRFQFGNMPVLSVPERPSEMVSSFSLAQNYPNPFNPITTIRYAIPARSHVILSVYNTLGQQIASLVSRVELAGFHEVKFDGTNLASGVYFYRIQAGSFVQTRKLLLLR